MIDSIQSFLESITGTVTAGTDIGSLAGQDITGSVTAGNDIGSLAAQGVGNDVGSERMSDDGNFGAV